MGSADDAGQKLTSCCPAWCQGRHDDLLPDSERCHASVMRRFSALVINRVPSGVGYKLARKQEQRHLEVQRFRFVDDDRDWIYVGDGYHYFELSLEGARVLSLQLADVFGDEATPHK